MALDTEVRDSLAQAQLDVQLAVLLGRPQAEPLPRDRAQQIALRQVGSLVRQLRLRAYQLDVACEPAVPQAGGNRVTSRAPADDQGSGRFLSSSRRRSRDQAR